MLKPFYVLSLFILNACNQHHAGSTIEISINRKNLPIIKNFALTPDLVSMGEVIIKRKKKWWQR
jgi:hypothetical protein